MRNCDQQPEWLNHYKAENSGKVATLATTQILQGILPLSVNGSIYDLPVGFTWLAVKAKIFGAIPGSVLIALVAAVIGNNFYDIFQIFKKIICIRK